MRTSTGHTGVSWAALVVGLAVGIAWLALFTVVHGVLGLVLVAAGFLALGLAGLLWGVDTTDGSSWSHRERLR